MISKKARNGKARCSKCVAFNIFRKNRYWCNCCCSWCRGFMAYQSIFAYRLVRVKKHNKALVRMQTTLRFVCTAQLGRSAKRQRPSMRGGICTPEATRFRGRATTPLIVKSVFPTVTLFPYWGIPSPHGFSKLQPFSVGAGPSSIRRNTPHQK